MDTKGWSGMSNFCSRENRAFPDEEFVDLANGTQVHIPHGDDPDDPKSAHTVLGWSARRVARSGDSRFWDIDGPDVTNLTAEETGEMPV
jgi:hypothetical protein